MRYTIILLVTVAALAAWYYPQLPDRLATHFDASGAADGWMQKSSFSVLFGFLLVFLSGTFLGTAAMIRLLPDSMINLPNKQYWLAPERREESFEAMGRFMYRMGEATLLLMGTLMVMTFEANLTAEPRLGTWSWIVLAAYLTVTGWQVWGLYRRFARGPAEPGAGGA